MFQLAAQTCHMGQRGWLQVRAGAAALDKRIGEGDRASLSPLAGSIIGIKVIVTSCPSYTPLNICSCRLCNAWSSFAPVV